MSIRNGWQKGEQFSPWMHSKVYQNGHPQKSSGIPTDLFKEISMQCTCNTNSTAQCTEKETGSPWDVLFDQSGGYLHGSDVKPKIKKL